MGRRKTRKEYSKKVHPSKKRRRREVHKCTQCDKQFTTFEDIKIHFLETHTKWKKDESSVEERQPNISIEKEHTSSETKTSNALTSTAGEKEAGNSSNHDFGQEIFFSKPTSTQKVQIIFECNWKNCGKCFKSFGDLDIHKKTQHVDKLANKCTKCDAEFDSFEVLKHHFLHTHTKWRKEDELNESKDDEDVTIVEDKTEDTTTKADTTKEKTNENCTKIVVNSKKVDKCLLVNTITTDSKVQGFLIDNTVQTKEKQTVPYVDDAIIDDPKNTYIIFSENSIVDTNNTAFYIVKTTPHIDNSISSIQDTLIYDLLTNNTVSCGAKNINEASSFSPLSEHNTSDPKPVEDCSENLITDLRNCTNNVKPVVKPTPKVVYHMPHERNTTSSVAKNIPDGPKVIKNTSSDVANTMPGVSKITSMIKKFLPVIRNIKSIPTVKPALKKTSPKGIPAIKPVLKKANPKGKLKRRKCYCFNCLSGSNNSFGQVTVHLCGDCGQEFVGEYDYYTHIREHDPFMTYFCPLSCGERFNKPGKLITHIHLHDRYEFNVCQICKKGFESVSHLERHSNLYHNGKSPQEISVNLDSDNNEINDEINFEDRLRNDNIEIANQAYPKEDIIEITDDISEVEDNAANSNTGISDEDYSSSEENTMNDITNVPGLIEDEVCLEFGENFENNIPPDPLSGFEDKPLSQIILNGEEESVGVVPNGITNLTADNLEFKPVQSIQIEQSMKPITFHNTFNITESNLNLAPETYKSMMQINREKEMRSMKTMEESIETFPNQIVLDEECMEYTPLVKIKREECIDPTSEQMINPEESVESIPTKRIKSEVETSINLVPGQKIHVADANFVMRSFNGNRDLRVQLERLPFFV